MSVRVIPFRFGGRRFAAVVEDLGVGPLPPSVGPAEREVACLLRRGLGNREIARRRGTSLRTVANQIASLMRKLGVGSRLELALQLGAPGDGGRKAPLAAK